jgi:hypothetical protein
MALPLLAAIPTAIQTGTGIYQAVKGNQMARSMDRPEYEIPQGVLDNLTDAQIQAIRGLPQEQISLYLDNVARSEQSALDAMSTRNAGLTGLSNVQQQSNDANRDLLSMNAQQRQINEKALMSARTDVAGYEDKAFQTNQMQPYLDMMQGAQAMKGAGIQNIMGGVQAGSSMGMDYLKYKDFMGSMFPSEVPKTPRPYVGISPEISKVINDPSLEYTPSGSDVLTRDPTVGYKSSNELLRGLGLNTGIYGGLKKG